MLQYPDKYAVKDLFDFQGRRWLALLFLLVFFAQVAFGARQLSLTYDEPIYTAIGYADLTTGDVRWHEVIGHPPLVNLLTAWPLLLAPERPDPQAVASWGTNDSLGFSRAILNQLGPLERVSFVTRVPVMWLAVLLAALVYRWAKQMWAGWAGPLALGLFTFDPHVVAHAQLNTTDMGVAAFGFASCYALACYLRRPSPGAYLGVGLGLGAAMASKASGAFWVGACGLVLVIYWLTGERQRRTLGTWALRFAGWAGLALLVLWAAYLFELRPLAPGGISVPAASHWAGLAYIRSYMASGQVTFLAGRLVDGGHWAYFPLALLLKTPLPVLIGLVVAIFWSLRRGVGPRWGAVPLLVVPVAYFVTAMVTALNIGHRHLLPVLPFGFVFISQVAARGRAFARPGRRWVYAVLGLLALWYGVETLAIFPHTLTYFNELAGGPDNGYRFLADSSVDWGQALKSLKSYLDARDDQEVYLSTFSSLDPALYDLSFEPIPPTLGAPIALTASFNPAPGTYVISAVPLQGVWVLDPDTYDWFRHREPVARVGHALFVYRVPAADPAPGWVAECAAPIPPLDREQIAAGFGRSDLRVVTFDCTQSWLYPAGGAGWTVLPGNGPLDAWAAARLAGVPLSFRQGEFWSHPALTIYAQQQTPVGATPPHSSARVAPSQWPLAEALSQGVVAQGPVRVGEPLSFLGSDVLIESDRVALHTYWRVEQVPQRPLSLMAHLLATDGTPLAIGDGLGVPVEGWQPGDVIVQRHLFDIAQAELPDGYVLQTGAYWLDTMERMPVRVAGQIAGDRLLLTMAQP